MTLEVILFTEDYQEAIEEVERLGGQVRHRFTDSIMAVRLPESVDLRALDKSHTGPPDSLDRTSKIIIAAWEAKQAKLKQEEIPNKVDGLSWGAEGYQPPRNPENDPVLADEERKFNQEQNR